METFKGSFDDAVNEFESLSESAFSYRLVSDVPVGVFLSGGIDSTYLAAILKKKIDLESILKELKKNSRIHERYEMIDL